MSFTSGRQGLRPLSVGETLDAAIKVYRSNARQLWKAVAVVVIPLEFIELLVRRSTLPSGVFVHDGTLYTTNLNGSTGGVLPLILVALLGLLVNLLGTGAVFKLVLDDYLGRPTSVSESFHYASGKVFSLLWLSILTVLLVAIGFILVIIPGIYFAVSCTVTVPVLMMEGVTGTSAIRRSFSLVRKRWWATLARLITALLLLLVASIIIGLIAAAINSALNVTNLTLYFVVNAILGVLISIFTTPFTSAVLTVIYIDLRVRKEGLDLEFFTEDGGPGDSGPGGPGPDDDGPGGRPPLESIGGWPRNQPDIPQFPTPRPRADPNEGTSIPPPGG